MQRQLAHLDPLFRTSRGVHGGAELPDYQGCVEALWGVEREGGGEEEDDDEDWQHGEDLIALSLVCARVLLFHPVVFHSLTLW